MANSNLKVTAVREQAQPELAARSLRESATCLPGAKTFSPKQHSMPF